MNSAKRSFIYQPAEHICHLVMKQRSPVPLRSRRRLHV